jgi:hypothetical protein
MPGRPFSMVMRGQGQPNPSIAHGTNQNGTDVLVVLVTMRDGRGGRDQ